MEFDIKPYWDKEIAETRISLSEELKKELNVIDGQFIKLNNKNSEVVLEIEGPVHTGQKDAYVNPNNYSRLDLSSLEFKILTVTLGCDPEFFILWKDRIISAATYLPYSGAVGADGTLGELRPPYAKNEYRLTENIQSLISQIPSKMRRKSWASGFPEDGKPFSILGHSYFRGLAAGFHIHLGIPPEILNTRKDFNRTAMNYIIQCLDWYLSVALIPLEENHNRRLGTTKYGKPGDYRTSNCTLEYRTPGGFYLRSPVLTKGILGIALLVTENIVSQMKNLSNNFVDLQRLTMEDFRKIIPIPDSKQIRTTLLSKEVSVSQNYIPEIKNTLSNLRNYKVHSSSVENFFREVEELRMPEPNLMNNWLSEKTTI